MKQNVTNLILFLCFLPSALLGQNHVFDLRDSTIGNDLLREGIDLISKEKPLQAYIKLDSAQQIYEAIYAKDNSKLGDVHHQKGTAKYRLTQFQDALIEFEMALKIRKKIYGDNHLQVAQTYNNMGATYKELGNYKEATRYYELSVKAREVLFKKKGITANQLYNAYLNLGNVYFSDQNFPFALKNYNKGLKILLDFTPEDVVNITGVYNNIANIYMQTGQFTDAKIVYEKNLKVQSRILKPDDPMLALTYSNLGYVYTQLQDFNQSLDYLMMALNIQLKKLGAYNSQTEVTYRSLGAAYMYLENYEEAINYYSKSIDIIEKAKGKYHPDLAILYNNIGLVYQIQKNTYKAISYLEKTQEIYKNMSKSPMLYLASCYLNLGLCYIDLKNFEKAIEYFQQSVEVKDKLLGHGTLASVQSLHQIANAYFLKNNDTKAIEYAELALSRAKYSTHVEYTFTSQTYYIINTLELLSRIYLNRYEKTKEMNYLINAKTYGDQAVLCINKVGAQKSKDETKSYFRNTHFKFFEPIIKINLLLHQLSKNDSLLHISFNYSEQSKARTLQELILKTKALNFADIPDSLLKQEVSLREYINFYEKQRQDSLYEGKSMTDSTVFLISNNLFKVQRQHDSLVSEFSRNYAHYYNLKYNSKTLNVQDIQKTLLTDNQTLLEYFVGDSSIYIFIVNKKDFKVTEVKNDFALDRLIRLFRFGLTGFHLAEIKTDSLKNAAPIAYTEGGRKLYDKLIAPIKNQLKEHVIIVPDGILNYIPFEALLKERNEKPYRFKAHKYLIDDHQISYAYSATILSEMQEKQHKTPPTKNLLAFAPFATQDTTILTDLTVLDTGEDTRTILKPLPASGQEVANIAALMKGNAYYDTTAIEPLFVKLAPEYRIIHLSTHGSANDKMGDYSYLSFSEIKDSIENERLYARDLYNLQLNAEMVVMSACETAIGELQRGEGMISLARAFTYSGAKSIVTTLWQVTDESSKTLMIDFYKFLNKGYTKVDALRRAKLRFIKRTDSNPFYWSGFIGMGDMKKL